jgi:hypothetical protein
MKGWRGEKEKEIQTQKENEERTAKYTMQEKRDIRNKE